MTAGEENRKDARASGLSMQRQIAEWMRQVMEAKNLSAEAWARLDGSISATTITRALAPDYPFVTKAVTLKRLAAAAGVEPPTFNESAT